jgi:hypothetical protein
MRRIFLSYIFLSYIFLSGAANEDQSRGLQKLFSVRSSGPFHYSCYFLDRSGKKAQVAAIIIIVDAFDQLAGIA